MRGKPALILAISTFLLFAFLTMASLQATYSDMQKEIGELREQCAEYDKEIAQYENDLSCDMDTAFIERIARERLGLCYPNETLMYYYLNK